MSAALDNVSVHNRQKLVHARTSCKDQVHGVLAKLGIEVTCSGHLRRLGNAVAG